MYDTIRCGYSQIRIVSAVSALGSDTVRYNTYCIYCFWVQIQWIQPVSASAPGPDTVDTYRTCRVGALLERDIGAVDVESVEK